MIFEESFLTAIAQVGFPIAVASYLLIRMEGKMSSLQKSIEKNTEATLLFTSKVKKCK